MRRTIRRRSKPALNRDADVEVTQVVLPANLRVGDTIVVTVTALNHGPNPASGVDVTDNLPAGLQFVSAATPQGTYDQATGRWTVGSLAVDATARLDITATVTSPGSITNLAVKTGQTEPDPNTANDSAAATINSAPAADVSVDKEVDRGDPLVGADGDVHGARSEPRAQSRDRGDDRGRAADGPDVRVRERIARFVQLGEPASGRSVRSALAVTQLSR